MGLAIDIPRYSVTTLTILGAFSHPRFTLQIVFDDLVLE